MRLFSGGLFTVRAQKPTPSGTLMKSFLPGLGGEARPAQRKPLPAPLAASRPVSGAPPPPDDVVWPVDRGVHGRAVAVARGGQRPRPRQRPAARGEHQECKPVAHPAQALVASQVTSSCPRRAPPGAHQPFTDRIMVIGSSSTALDLRALGLDERAALSPKVGVLFSS